MPFALLLLVVGAIAWRFIAPGEQFLPGFARLLTDRRIDRSPFSFFSGRSQLSGRFQDREVTLWLVLKRHRYEQGHLVLGVKTSGPPSLNYDGIEARVQDDAGRRALFAIAANDLLLSVENGWLRALWQPQGLIIFPGRFSDERWLKVLDAMATLARSLEAAA